MTPRFPLVSGPFLGLLLLVPILGTAGCEGFQPTRLPVGDTVSLFSLARAEYIGRPSGFDFTRTRPVVVESPKNVDPADFDIAYSEVDGEPVWLPAGIFESFGIEPGIAVDSSGVSWEALSRAPDDGYVDDGPVPIRQDWLYIVRSRRLRTCRQYAKVEVLEIDPEGIVEFRFLLNNLCNDRDLTDIEEDDG